jgi:cytochrome c-type biogenesis protein CcmH/NrfF
VDSDHPFALALREVSVQRLREGMTVEALRRELEDRYGPEIWQDLPRDTPAASMWLMGGSVVLMLALVRWLTVHPWR